MSQSRHQSPPRTHSATSTRASTGWSRLTTRLSGAAFLFVGLSAWAATAHAQTLTVGGGDAQVVWNHDGEACDALDIPDAPARAIRLVDGSVQLYAPHFNNRRLRGRGLLDLRPDCAIVYRGREDDDPAGFDDRTWIAAPYTLDGKTIYAVLHNEFQGNRRPALCPTGRYIDCWYNALTFAVSRDAGGRFERLPGEVAVLPYRYDQVVGAHSGYFNPTNILHVGDDWVMMAFATRARAQAEGNILLRTRNIADPAAWRAWDGDSFAVRFADPYAKPPPGDARLPRPVAPGALRWPVTSLVRHAPSGRFIALMMAGGGAAPGVYAATSADLLTWSAPQRVLAAVGPEGWRPGMPAPIAYPSLLDPASPSRNFETVGAHPMLFVTRSNPCGAVLCMDRDLVRFSVTISDAPQ